MSLPPLALSEPASGPPFGFVRAARAVRIGAGAELELEGEPRVLALLFGDESLLSLLIELVLDDLDLDLTGDFPYKLELDWEGLSLALLNLGNILSSLLEELDPDPLDEALGLGLELGLLLSFLFPDLTRRGSQGAAF